VSSDGGGAVNHVTELTLEEVRSIAHGLVAPTDEAEGQGSRLQGAPVSAGMFGRSGAGEALAGTHRTAHQIFRETVDQVIADLEAFREQLISTVATYESRDEDVAAAHAALEAFRWQERTHHVAIDAGRADDLAGAGDAPVVPATPSTPAPAAPPADEYK